MIAHKKIFFIGVGMLALFTVVLIIFFSPVFNGQNGLEFLDNLYNSISKGSAYYIPKAKEESEKFLNQSINVTVTMDSKKQAEQTAPLFEKGGASVEVSGSDLKITGDLGEILANCLADADLMYHNEGQKIADKYGSDERLALFNWWKACNALDKSLKKQEKFKEADVVLLVKKKAVETSYNYYKIEPQKITDRIWLVIFSLVFYVVYTMWYGFGIMYLFEGWGLQLEDH